MSNNIINLKRDVAGIYPIYYYHKNSLFLYANSLNDLVKHPDFIKEINLDSLALYFQFGYFPEPYTIYKNAYKLSAGHSLKYNLNTNELTINKYWDIANIYSLPKLNLTDEEAVQETESIMIESYLDSYLRSDDPGVLLSGGYDSSSVAAILQSHSGKRIKTFSIGFNDSKFNEANHAREIANYLGTEHFEHYCTEKDASYLINKLSDILDEPMGDASIIPTTLACLLASKHVSDILSADGPDELLGGYDKYLSINKKAMLFGNFPKLAIRPTRYAMQSRLVAKFLSIAGMNNSIDRLERFSYMLGENESQLLKINNSTFNSNEINKLLTFKHDYLKTNYDSKLGDNIVEKSMTLDFKTSAVDAVLLKVHKAAKYAGINNIEPVLNRKLIEHFIRLEMNQKIRDNHKKYILKKIVHKYIPEKIMNRPKMGFGVPLINWFNNDLKRYLIEYLNEDSIRRHGFLNYKYVIKLRDSYFNGKSENITKLWYILVFQLWYEKWMK